MSGRGRGRGGSRGRGRFGGGTFDIRDEDGSYVTKDLAVPPPLFPASDHTHTVVTLSAPPFAANPLTCDNTHLMRIDIRLNAQFMAAGFNFSRCSCKAPKTARQKARGGCCEGARNQMQ